MYITVRLLNGFQKPLLYKLSGINDHHATLIDSLVGSMVIVPLQKRFEPAIVIAVHEHLTYSVNFAIKEISFDNIKQIDDRYFRFIQTLSQYYRTDIIHFAKRIQQFVTQKQTPPLAVDPHLAHTKSNTTLTSDQERIYIACAYSVAHPTFFPALIHGVTGSGKTEIYKKLLIDCTAKGNAALFLVPEVTLALQFEQLLRAQLPENITIISFHSATSSQDKKQLWRFITNRKPLIIIGVHLPILLPIAHLGLIIVDEEHDDSYKSMTRPRYHARDVAVLMGQKLGAKVVLASATPSMTSYHKYDVVKLDKPYVAAKKHYTFISGDKIDKNMLNALHKNHQNKAQSLLFLPTRGNFKYLYCQSCGKTHLCPYCSVGMALHRNKRHLKCHYCNFTEAIAEKCTQCGHAPLTSERMGTQEAIEVIQTAIADIQVEQFDKDSITTNKKLKEALGRFESGESHVLLGTQMLSKGHDYANITLSIIMGLDYILGLSDYRARERAMSLFFQIAGRSGRTQAADVLVQTGDAAFFQNYLSDYELFIKDELAFLEMADYPPFVSLSRILIAHKDESKAAKITLDTVTKLKSFTNIEIVGSGKAPVERIANKYRFHILLRSKNRVPLLKALHAVDCREIEIDFDPVEFS